MFAARLIAAASVLLAAMPASAHTLGASGAGFAAGFAHPAGGLDHLLAMVAVGLWAAQSGGRALWTVPAAFMGAMLLGGAMGLAGVALPGIELGIGASVMVLGLLVALAVRAPAALSMAVVGVFALFHGHAHGAEMPEAAAPVLYALGFFLATGLLHASGLAGAFLVRNAQLVRVAGCAIALSGVVLLLG